MAKRRQAVTIRHVAAEAGVSLQTVSRVINKAPNVRDELVERVQAAIGRLGYVPSIAAQQMAGAHSYLILALNDRERTIADWRERLGTDWVDQMLLGGMLTCAEHGYRMMIELVDTHGANVERELLATLAALRPDGIILTPPHSSNPIITGLLAAHRIGVARIGTRLPGPGFALTMGDEQAAREATDHLAGLGHRRIALISGPDEYELSGWRIDGWRAAMAAASLDVEGLLVHGDFSYESGRAAVAALLDAKAPPTAIIGGNDRMSLAVLDHARARGLAVPADLSIVSFDDTPATRLTHPPLTSICQPVAAITARAVELIIAQRAGRERLDDAVVIPARLVVRDSSGPPRADSTT